MLHIFRMDSYMGANWQSRLYVLHS